MNSYLHTAYYRTFPVNFIKNVNFNIFIPYRIRPLNKNLPYPWRCPTEEIILRTRKK